MIELSWSTFKTKCLDQDWPFKYFDVENTYHIYARKNDFNVLCKIYKDSGADQTDFETNYIANEYVQDEYIVTGLPEALGQKTKAQSTSVVMASDQTLIFNPYELNRIVAGEMFSHNHTHTLASNGTYKHLIVSPNTATRIYLRLNIFMSKGGSFAFYESPTVSANGSAGSLYNLERNLSNTPELAVYHAPTTSANGTLIQEFTMSAEAGISAVYSNYWILKQNTNYLLIYTSTASNNTFSENLNWYEV